MTEQLPAFAQEVVRRTQYVRIDENRLRAFVPLLATQREYHWLDDCPVTLPATLDERLQFLGVADSLSFAYWMDPSWNPLYQGRELSRATWRMYGALVTAFEEGKPVLDFGWWARATVREVGDVLQQQSGVLLDLRHRTIVDFAHSVNAFGLGKIGTYVSRCYYDANCLVGVLASELERNGPFSDSSRYDGIELRFNKRAQLLTSDISRALEAFGEDRLRNVRRLTACTDYREPQVLRHYGVMVFEPSFASAIDRGDIFDPDDPRVVAMRCANLVAVDELAKALHVNAMDANDRVWCLGLNPERFGKPHIKVKTNRF
jgi:hypothetical protein